jgi:hypothetical protein
VKVLWLSALWCANLSVWGCVMPNSSGDAGTTSIPLVTGDSGALTHSATGTGCGTDPSSGITLCVGTSGCPSVRVDQSVFPECGFYFANGNVYLVCLCAGSLCPIGQPTTCNAAASLLDSTNEGAVCAEISNPGGCTALGTAAAAMDGGSDSGSGSGCDESCAAMCAGEPDCLPLCGC